MEKRERVERTLFFERSDRSPLTDSFQHVGIIAHYAGITERNDLTTEEVCKAASNALDMVQGWGLGPSFTPNLLVGCLMTPAFRSAKKLLTGRL